MYGVCLVDDEYFVAKSLESRLDWESLGFRILGTAGSGAEAESLCARVRPELVFTDIRMPGMDGLELIRRLKARFPEMLFIVISGYAEFQYAKEALNLGAIGFCTKPFDDDELLAVLERARGRLDARAADAAPPEEPSFQGPAGEICTFLHEHYGDPGLSAQSVADKFGFSPNYLSQMFKKATGENLIGYLTKLRIRRACDLLKKSALPVGEIGQRVGYPDYFYFAKVFKKSVGVTPTEYRKVSAN